MLTSRDYVPKYKASAIHILGTAFSIPGDDDYSTEPFTNKAMFFSKAFYDAGYPVFFYGVDGGD